MRISVVIPVYNRFELVARAIKSVMAQTISPHEVIIVDDGSTDGTADRVRADFPDVVLLQNARNQGVSHARNRGIRHAHGDWVAFLDSDDEWLPQKLARQMSAIGEQSQTPLCHSDEIWIRNGIRVNPKHKHQKRGGFIFEHCLPLCVISPSSALIDRAVLLDIGLFDENLPACEDYDLWLRLCALWPVSFVPDPLLVKYGGHEDQLSRQHWGMDRFRVTALEKLLNSQTLSSSKQEAVMKTMIEKLEILINGSSKRGKQDQASQWNMQLKRCRSRLNADKAFS